jgi:hypothetical protein
MKFGLKQLPGYGIDVYMGKTKGPYNEEFPVGGCIRIADLSVLLDFKSNWKWHHPLVEDQLCYAGTRTVVRAVSFYHGGDELYQLENVPGTWHEACLSLNPKDRW